MELGLSQTRPTAEPSVLARTTGQPRSLSATGHEHTLKSRGEHLGTGGEPAQTGEHRPTATSWQGAGLHQSRKGTSRAVEQQGRNRHRHNRGQPEVTGQGAGSSGRCPRVLDPVPWIDLRGTQAPDGVYVCAERGESGEASPQTPKRCRDPPLDSRPHPPPSANGTLPPPPPLCGPERATPLPAPQFPPL